MLLDPPAMVAQAMKQTVRRMRLAEIATHHPGLILTRTDVGDGTAPDGALVVDFANIICSVTTGKIGDLKDTPEWCKKKSASLLSAVAGGQWTPVRRAAVLKWNITDTRCHLCYEESGTV